MARCLSSAIAALGLSLGAAACGRTAVLPLDTGADRPNGAGISPATAGRAGRMDGAAGVETAPPEGPFRCRVTKRFTAVAGLSDSFAVAVAVNGQRFGLLWLDEGTPWRLMFRAFNLDGDPIGDPLAVSETPLRPKAALVAHGRALIATWLDWRGGDRMRVTTFAEGQPMRELAIADTATADDPSLAISPSGRMVLSWTREAGGAGYQRVFAESTDGAIFSVPVVLDSGAARPTFASSVSTGSGVAHAWVARTNQPNRSALVHARTEEGGAALAPVVLVDHERYIYDTAIAFAAGRIAIATTDSRVNIGVVPLYLTLLEPDGTLVAEGIRLTHDHHHESIDLAAGSASFVTVADVFVGAESENRVFLRQVDRDGTLLFDPLRVSSDEIPPGTRRGQEPKITAIAPDRYLTVWGERATGNPRTVYVIRAGIVDCGPAR